SPPQDVLDQAAALRAEGVDVTRGPLGQWMVDFGVCGWFPGVLPSEELEEESRGGHGDDDGGGDGGDDDGGGGGGGGGGATDGTEN
ncbi:hypothetical protein E4U41_006679, partial [Claviceps citrina]